MKHLHDEKVSRSHSSVTDAAFLIVKILIEQPEVVKVVLGKIDVIKSGGGTGEWTVKIVVRGKFLELRIKQSSSAQSINVYSNSFGKTIEAIQDFAKNGRKKGRKYRVTVLGNS